MKYLQRKKEKGMTLRHWLSTPFIYLVFIPIVFADLIIEIYHRIGFRLYGLPYVRRSMYVRIDRHKLKYLNLFQKVNCVYCGYVNGVMGYWVRIAGETEHYWCGIQHQKKKNQSFVAPSHHKDFAEFGSKADFEEKFDIF